MRPDLYPSTAVAGKSRAQVKSELAEAQRNGEMIANGELGLRDKDMEPSLYPRDPVVAGKTREEVKAETMLAIRDGDMLAPGETGMTEYQMHPQYYAHQRAIDSATRLAHQKEAAPTTDGQ